MIFCSVKTVIIATPILFVKLNEKFSVKYYIYDK